MDEVPDGLHTLRNGLPVADDPRRAQRLVHDVPDGEARLAREGVDEVGAVALAVRIEVRRDAQASRVWNPIVDVDVDARHLLVEAAVPYDGHRRDAPIVGGPNEVAEPAQERIALMLVDDIGQKWA